MKLCLVFKAPAEDITMKDDIVSQQRHLGGRESSMRDKTAQSSKGSYLY